MFFRNESFQKTKIGKIPADWKVAKIGHITKTEAGGTPSTSVKEYWGGNVPWINSGELKNGIVDKPSAYITKRGLENSAAKLLSPDTVLIALTGATTGIVGYLTFKCSTNQSVVGILPNSRFFVPKFMFYSLVHNRKRVLTYNVGSAQPHINKKIVDDFLISLPPIYEQEAIVEVLSAIDSAIVLADKVIMKTERLKKGLLRQLLTRGIGHSEVKKSRVGEIPKEWNIAKLGEIAKIRYGLGQPPESDENGVPMIRATNIERGAIVETDMLRVKRSTIPESRMLPLQEGDILVVRSGAYTGDIGYITKKWEGSIAGYDLVVSPSKHVNSMYLAHYLLSSKAQTYFSQLKSRSAQPHLNSEQVSGTPIALPTLPEQEHIADILSTIDRKFSFERDAMVKLGRIKQGLMDLLLTGKIRIRTG